MNRSAVVFAYGDIGIRCIQVLLAGGVNIRLVVTHEDDPRETRWYGSVAELAAEYSLPCIAPGSADAPALLEQVRSQQCDFIFSFYYRLMLPAELLACAGAGAFNMHGSLLPRFRGRAPLNWAIVRGARETGATLHHMVERADAGDVVDQFAVPILPDDDALAVFRKITVAAELVLARSLPKLIDGTAARIPQRLDQGEYCGRRTPDDGRIDWSKPAREIHDLVRAVAPPFPGAFTEILGERWNIHRTRVIAERAMPSRQAALMNSHEGKCVVTCIDGSLLHILAAERARRPLGLADLVGRLAHSPLALA